jgi:hypothetical protein
MLRTALLIGFLTGAVFLIAVGDRLVFANDEGIYLEGAVRVFHGEAPYRDFFAITGPGTFRMLAALFHRRFARKCPPAARSGPGGDDGNDVLDRGAFRAAFDGRVRGAAVCGAGHRCA